MAERTIAVAITPPPPSALIEVNVAPNRWLRSSTVTGYASFQWDDSLGDSAIRITAAGYLPYVVSCHWKQAGDPNVGPPPLNHQLTIGIDLPPLQPDLTVLHVEGLDFVDDQGKKFVLKGCDQFMAYRMFLDGTDLSPLLLESEALGFNYWRVFMMGSKAQNGLLQLTHNDQGYWTGLRPFADFLNANGIGLLATVFVDAQDVCPDPHVQLSVWLDMGVQLEGTNTLMSGGNEWRKNGFNPGNLTPLPLLWSRGSDLGDNPPFAPAGSFMEFHPRRDLPAALMDTVASPVFIYGNVAKVPLIIDEPPRMGLDGSGPDYADPHVCWKFARHYSTECAGAVFHSRPGQQGRVMDPLTRSCAQSWLSGLNL